MPGLGRRYSPDERDRLYHASRHLAAAPAALPPVTVHIPSVLLDQQSTPRCTAFAWRALLNIYSIYTGPSADTIYLAEQQSDGFQHTLPLPDDSDGTGGSSVRAGAAYLKSLGIISEYVWASDIDTLARWVLTRGPAVLGTDWHEDMFNPDPRGFVRPTGAVVGGHAFLCVGYSRLTGDFVFQNSWGGDWGSKLLPTRKRRGFFRMTSADVAALLAADGEAAGAVEVAK